VNGYFFAVLTPRGERERGQQYDTRVGLPSKRCLEAGSGSGRIGVEPAEGMEERNDNSPWQVKNYNP
jgi:hypothetical protein